MVYVLDANALIRLVERYKYDALRIAENSYSTDLVGYELGNTLWKYMRQGISVSFTIEFMMEMLRRLNIIPIGLNRDVLDLAVKNNVAYYGASYVYLARKLNAKLVTEDKELLRKFPNYTVEPGLI